MISSMFFAFLAVAVLIAFVNWRLGLFLLIAVGALQDPVRKMMPGAPSLMVLAFLPVWLAAVAGMLSSGQWRWRKFSFHYPELRKSITLMLPVLFLAVVVLIYNYGLIAWKVALVGLFAYSLPILTLIIGFAYARSERDVCRFIQFYSLITSIMLVGGILEVMNLLPDWNALGTSTLGMHWIKYVSWGHTIDLIAGFYRSPDIMGWHAATLSILSLTMALYGKAGPRWFWLMLASWGVLLVLISGRNKMLGMTTVWIAVVAIIYFYYGRLGKLIAIFGATGLLVFAVILMSGKLDLNQDYILYASQIIDGTGSGGSTLERLDKELIQTSVNTYRQSGFFGKGIGISSQGIQHLGLNIRRAWQESGLSRILVELGIPGLIAMSFFVWSMFLILRRMIVSQKGGAQVPVLQVSLIAFSIANVSNFVISHQVFSDGVVIVILTLFIGMLLASPAWLHVQRR